MVFLALSSCEGPEVDRDSLAAQDRVTELVIEAGYKEAGPPQYDPRNMVWVTTVVLSGCTTGIVVETNVVSSVDEMPRVFRVVHDNVSYRDSWRMTADELREYLGLEVLDCLAS